MSDDEINENIEETNTTAKDKSAKQIQKLNEYVQQMTYKPVPSQAASKRTEALSKASKKYILGTYAEHKNNFQPKERSKRVRRIVQQHTPITIEKLEEFIRKHRKKQSQYEKDKKQQHIKYLETLSKFQKQCENQVMNAIVHKFAKVVSKRACVLSPYDDQTESCQRLQNSLFCEMIMALKVPNEQQTRDVAIYKKLAAVFADLILQALFLAHNSDDQNCASEEGLVVPDTLEKDLVIRLRALRAANKKVHSKRLKNARGCAVLSHR